MPAASMKQLLEAGVHFGHQTRRWNPKMKPYIFTERGGIHIIDLQQTTVLLDKAYDFVRNVASRGGTILFVGTKKQCQDVIAEEATRVGMPYVSHRWLGGLLTNFLTIDNRIKRMHELRKLKEDDQLGLLPTKERMAMERELEKLEINLGGVSTMSRLPDAVFVADPKRETIATKEVKKLGLPLIGLCDTNCDPDEVEYLIPGNDDAIRSCSLIMKTLARAVEEGRAKIQVADFLAAEAARAEEQGEGRTYGGGEGAREAHARSRSSRPSRGTGSDMGDERQRGARRGAGEGARRGARPETASRAMQARRAPRPSGGPTAAKAAGKEAVAETEAPVEAVAAVASEAPAPEETTVKAPIAEAEATESTKDQVTEEADGEA
jgi:small subunit ribosomal protein S2